MEKFERLNDERLVELCREGNDSAEEVLISRYTKHVRSLARPYFLAGGDSEDLIQEGMIGVVKAIAGFNPCGDASFKTFAFACIRNKLYSAIKNAAGSRHSPLNNYISFDAPLLPFVADDPVEAIIDRESSRELFTKLEGILSRFELNVLELYLEGLSYAEISESVSKPQKSVDNAVQRIRRKFGSHISALGDIR